MERELLEKVKNRDKKAFEEIYNMHSDYALRVALVITKNKANAADAVQETFIRIYKYIDSYDLNKPFKTWFYRILINECNRVLNKNSNIILIDDFKTIDCEKHSKTGDNYENLYEAIKNLEDINRIPIVLMYIEGFSEVEISKILNLNINTVKSRLYKGRQKLKKMLTSTNGGDLYDE